VQHHLCVVSRAALSTGVFFGVANFIRSHATDPCSSGPGVVAVLCGGAGGSIASSITDASLEHLFNQSSSKTNLHVTPQQLVNHVAVAHGGVTVPTPLTMAPLVEMPLDLVAANLKPIALALAEHSGENLTFGAAGVYVFMYVCICIFIVRAFESRVLFARRCVYWYACLL